MQTISFKKLMLKQIAIAVATSFIISFVITLIPGYLLLKANIQNDLKQLQKTSHDEISLHLATGWQPQNIQIILQHLQQEIPNAVFYLLKAEPFTETHNHASATPPESVIRQMDEAKLKQTIAYDTDLVNGKLYAAYPIYFEKQCLTCHMQAVQAGSIREGQLAGTMAFQAPISVKYISSVSMLLFFVLFLFSFITIGVFLTQRLLQDKLIKPLHTLSGRIAKLKLDTKTQEADWKRTPNEILEIDRIDEEISKHIHKIQGIYSKLDALIVTEHETGVFHKDRFNEVMRYEMLRSQRYEHAFSVIVVKLAKVLPIDQNLANQGLNEEQKSAATVEFSDQLVNHTRVTDLIFRITDSLFVIIAPETDQAGVLGLKQHLSQELKSEVQTSREYHFEFQIGQATYGEDGVTSKQLMHEALINLSPIENTLPNNPNN